ncbi:GLPGLI family protein [Pinibacter aurantiacus]|uniref:GLPGLI family protein n=1 Tax=Pinibacter aurantiacus TaxID=2851599 RepID=A0A9E2SBC2_9BACT|nr:GLPGLI family protein [Pinibacter aurantiacus]MBV4357335.1 GLPGLI family protein [Pinibacter aurantiacus]
MKLVVLILFQLLLGFNSSFCQQPEIIRGGVIEYERKFNIYSLYSKNDPNAAEQKRMYSQFKTNYYNLYFSESETLYKEGRAATENTVFPSQPGEENIVFTDLKNKKRISEKKVFETVFTIGDSLRKIEWKIKEERRYIAGFECKRADAVIMDSIYIVAYFCEQIVTSGGPESIGGLPGMILGLAIPIEHVTWFATKVSSNNEVEINKIRTKEKIISYLEFKDFILSHSKVWGERKTIYTISCLL